MQHVPESSPPSPLLISSLYKSYGKQEVLRDVSFSLQPGEIFGLIGLNGVGKTTLIKSILSLCSTNSGNISLFGLPPASVAARRHYAYLPEKFQPSKYLRGMEYLHLTLAYYSKTLNTERAEAEAAALDLDPARLASRISSYSKGMGQKLGLAGAFLSDTELLILDEPMSGLDPLARIRLKERLLRCKEEGRTIFFSSHILADIDEICDRIGIIHNNRLLYLGTPAELRQAHTSDSLEQSFLRRISA